MNSLKLGFLESGKMVYFHPVNTHEPPKLDTSNLEKVEVSLQHPLLPTEGAQAGGRTQKWNLQGFVRYLL